MHRHRQNCKNSVGGKAEDNDEDEEHDKDGDDDFASD